MKYWQKAILYTLCTIMLMPLMSCGGKDPVGARIVPPERQYTIWSRAGDENFIDYGDNPGVEYLETLAYGTDEKGSEKYIDLSFFVPVTGSEADSFNTLIATGEYYDVMDLSAYSGKAIDLYEEGIALDITDWVEGYMPNYKAFLDAHPDLKATATNLINGENRYIQLYSYADEVADMWGGYQYRRDWIVKYGKNPVDGSAFSGAFSSINDDGTPNLDSWEDNVVFPSGGPDPVYISDWEWMFPIFDLALEDLGIADGYGMSLFSPGYIETGDLICAFGGGNATWHKTPDNKIVYGGTSDTFRTYLQAMNAWFANGWIDPAFPEHTSDMFYMIDNARIFSGKVGLWYGTTASLGGRLANPDDPNLAGFVSFSAAQPINDVYGSENELFKTPFAMYQSSQEGSTYAIMISVQDKDMETFFTFLDLMYSKEGAAIKSFGLSKEQYEVTKNAFMTENGFTEGAYTLVAEEDGVTRYQFHQNIREKGLEGSMAAIRLPGLDLTSLRSTKDLDEGYLRNLDRWTMYKNTGWLTGSFIGQLSAGDSQTVTKVNTNVSEFMAKNVPPFIKGVKDPNNDEDWNAFKSALNKYGPGKVTSMLQGLLEMLYAK